MPTESGPKGQSRLPTVRKNQILKVARHVRKEYTRKDAVFSIVACRMKRVIKVNAHQQVVVLYKPLLPRIIFGSRIHENQLL